jgi:hypothetical protein
MSRSQKLINDFPDERNLEVQMQSGRWCRVTCFTFRSYFGPRRVDGMPFDGLYFYEGTNMLYEVGLDDQFTHKILERTDIPKTKTNSTTKRFKRVGL